MMEDNSDAVSCGFDSFASHRLVCFQDCGRWHKHKLMIFKLLYFPVWFFFCDLNISKRVWLCEILLFLHCFNLSHLVCPHLHFYKKFHVSHSRNSLFSPKCSIVCVSEEYFLFPQLVSAPAWMINKEGLTWDQVTKAVQPASLTVIQTSFLFPPTKPRIYPACISNVQAHCMSLNTSEGLKTLSWFSVKQWLIVWAWLYVHTACQ